MNSEQLLHFVWQYKLFYTNNLRTTSGDEVDIINVGILNTDAGPDFFNAQVRIGNITWAGNIEIHNSSDDWYAHHHDSDAAYNNVILHVVGKSSGRAIKDSNGRVVPEMVLKYPEQIDNRYAHWSNASGYVRCSGYLPNMQKITRDGFLDRLLFERMEILNERVETLLTEFNGDWAQTLFCLLARSMGFVVNAEAMLSMARRTPVNIMLKHAEPIQREALLLGQAGMLSTQAAQEEQNEHLRLLQREYEFLRIKFNLTPVDVSIWKQLRLRPSNMPAIRISQLAAIIGAIGSNFESSLLSMDAKTITNTLNVSASEYFDNHFIIGKTSGSKTTKHLGKQARQLIIINTVVPYLFAYHHRYGNTDELYNTINMLKSIPTESNSRLDIFANYGLKAENEGEAQALLHLYKDYCQSHRCLQCRFGLEFLAHDINTSTANNL
ncbi:MAG: DUF2851 family protein [Marinilabiliaceae bacterium]|nr:DUF2851 family protein [Marinilabiliaceae bacterium]